MSRRLAFWLCLLLVTSVQASEIRVADDDGQVFEFTRPPQRIISLAPHLTELLFAVGAGVQVVGADTASTYPEAAKALPRVGDYSRVNFERVLALKPDLVIVWTGGTRAADIHGLEKLGVPVMHTQAARLSDVARLLRLVGQVSGHAQEGVAAAEDYLARLRALQVSDRQKPPLRVFYQVWDRPLITVGGPHWISEALALCGARNVFADLRGASPVVSREAVLRSAPALIVSGGDAPDAYRQWQRFVSLPAVKNRAFVRVNADLLHRPTPRLVDGVAELCAALAPYR